MRVVGLFGTGPALCRNLRSRWSALKLLLSSTLSNGLREYLPWGYCKTLWNIFGSWVSGTSGEFSSFFSKCQLMLQRNGFKISICPCFYFTNPKRFSLPMNCGLSHCVFWIVWIFFFKVRYLWFRIFMVCMLIVGKKKKIHQILPSRLEWLLQGCYGPSGKYILWNAY